MKNNENQKIMKKVKLFSLVLLAIITFSCSSNDEDSLSSNSIVGTWKPIKEVDVCSTGKEDVYELTSCQQESRYTFKLHTNQSLQTDGIITINQKSLENGECKTYSNETGTWSLNGNEIEIIVGNETNKPTFFELNSNTMRIGYYDNDPRNPSCDGGNLTSHYYTEFIRVN